MGINYKITSYSDYHGFGDVFCNLKSGVIKDISYLIKCGIYNDNLIEIQEEHKSFSIHERQDIGKSTFISYINKINKNLAFFNDKVEKDENDSKYFAISIIDESDKFSTEYFDCTGIFAVGKSKKTGKNISFLTHQNPKAVLSEEFKLGLTESINNLLDLSEEETIDIVIFGGNSNFNYLWYEKIMKELNDIIFFSSGIIPVSLGGPTDNIIEGEQNYTDKEIFISTQNRIMEYYKPHRNYKTNNNFLLFDIDNFINSIKLK